MSGQASPSSGSPRKDFVVKVDKQTRKTESVEYVTTDAAKPFYLLAFKPAPSERGTGPHTAEIIATIEKRALKGKYTFTVPRP